MPIWSKTKQKPHCLVTITSSDFVPGTLVMLYSFFKHNKWFDGDVIIYACDLNLQEKQMLERFPNVIFAEPEKDLSDAIERVVAVSPQLGPRKMIFYSLNIFRLKGYNRYLYIDSDVLICSDFSELMAMVHPMMCVPDRATYMGKAKDSITYLTVQPQSTTGQYWYRTFNAGIMFFTADWINEKNYRKLLGFLVPELYQELKHPTTDQYLLNKCFHKNYHLLPGTYNFRLGLAEIMKAQEGCTLDTAKLIHFAGKRKPWVHQHIERAIPKVPLFYEAMMKWQNAYHEYLGFVKQYEDGQSAQSLLSKGKGE